MSFIRTTAINKLAALKKRKCIVQGGTWAGKTYGIIPVLIDKAGKCPNRVIEVVAESIPAIKAGALRNFQNIMMDTKRWNPDCFNATDRTYTFSSGSVMKFSSFDTIGKAHAAGKRTDLFLNEANYISFLIADALIMRTEERVWIDFNPVEEFWAHTEIMPQKDAEFIVLKYTDNEALPPTILEELRMKQEKALTSPYWANWCRIYIDGEIGTLEGIIFQNFKQVPEMPKDCKWKCYGLDFGYTNDPTALTEIGLYQGELFFDEKIYKTRLTNPDIDKLLRELGIGYNDEIIADSAEPKSIKELQDMGWNIKGAVKGPDSVVHGIELLHEYNINITQASLNGIKEARNYKWKYDKAKGAFYNEPEDAFNHFWDSVRYATSYKLSRGIYVEPGWFPEQ